MPNTDVITATLPELAPTLTELFLSSHPALEQMFKSKRKAKGHRQEFVVMTGGPGGVVKYSDGEETDDRVRTQNSRKGAEYGTRVIYRYRVPMKDLADIDGAQGVKDLIKQYPVLAIGDMSEGFIAQIMRGAATSGALPATLQDFDGVTTLNGGQTYEPEAGLGARAGIFQFQAPALQTATVHDLPSAGAGVSPTAGWYNQFLEIGNSVELVPGLRAVHQLASTEGGSFLGKVDQMYADVNSYLNLLEELSQSVRTPTVNGDIVGSKGIATRDGVPFQGGTVFQEPAIDMSDATSWGANVGKGIIYGLNTSVIEAFNHGASTEDVTDGCMSYRKGIRVPGTDMIEYDIVFHGNFYTTNRRAHFALLGGAEGGLV
jgi:hypothetical protein